MAKTHLKGKTDRCDSRCKDADRGANMASLHNIESAERGSQGSRGMEEQVHWVGKETMGWEAAELI